MKSILPALLKDFYKVGHPAQYPEGTTLVYSNFTPRGTRRVNDAGGVINFGPQYFVQDHLIDQFNEGFFQRPREEVIAEYKRILDYSLGPGSPINHIGELHELGYLPLRVKALPEGTLVPYRVPVLTIQSTDPKFYWLTNDRETALSNILWLPMTSATTAFLYRRNFERYAKLTGADRKFIKWQGHDFSYRGMSGLEAACLSGAAHLLSFTGTDTIPAIPFLEHYYGANVEKELVGGSVPATEHAVMCIGLKDNEFETIDRLLFEIYPDAPVLSIVSDTWDFWKVVTEYLPSRLNRILARPGKFVLRPDSGDPVKIVAGDPFAETPHERMGLTRYLYEIFGGPTNAAGFKELDPHIGWIYGDSITLDRQEEILGRLHAQGFVSTIPVLGIGSYTYQYVTRDTDGFAMKATYGEVKGVGHNISKNPATDDGVKKSASGLLRVVDTLYGLQCWEDCTWDLEDGGVLQDIFLNGKAHNIQTLAQIRKVVESQL